MLESIKNDLFKPYEYGETLIYDQDGPLEKECTFIKIDDDFDGYCIVSFKDMDGRYSYVNPKNLSRKTY